MARRKVALIIESSSQYGRELLSGIIRYLRIHDDWSVILDQRGLFEHPPRWLNNWQGDGIISRVTNKFLVQAALRNQIPFVELTDRQDESPFVKVRSDDHQIGRLGAEHFLERGFKNFAFCGFSGENWSARRQEGFVEKIRDVSNSGCEVFNSFWVRSEKQTWEDDQQDLIEWLQQLPLPLGMLASNDARGKDVIDACRSLNLSIPEQVAVLGVDNEEQLCSLCSPPLSSIIPNAETVGYRAAEILTRLMNGEILEDQQELIPPVSVLTRQSTDVVAVDDAEIARALNYIREHACQNICVDDVLRHVSVSRSTLERQCRNYLGRSPQEQIRFEQIKRAQQLIRETDLPLEQVAWKCGFEHPEYMHVVFKRLTGSTPGSLRKQN